jgi:hypothetical protein
MKQSRVNVFLKIIFTFKERAFLPQAPSQETGGPRTKMRRDSFRPAAYTPIRARQSDGTSNFIQPKAPILRDVVPTGPLLHLVRMLSLIPPV